MDGWIEATAAAMAATPLLPGCWSRRRRRRAAATMILPVPSPLPLRLPPASVGDFCQILGSERAALFSAAAARFNFFLLLGRGCCDDFAPYLPRSFVPLPSRIVRRGRRCSFIVSKMTLRWCVWWDAPSRRQNISAGNSHRQGRKEGGRGTISNLRVPLCPG